MFNIFFQILTIEFFVAQFGTIDWLWSFLAQNCKFNQSSQSQSAETFHMLSFNQFNKITKWSYKSKKTKCLFSVACMWLICSCCCCMFVRNWFIFIYFSYFYTISTTVAGNLHKTRNTPSLLMRHYPRRLDFLFFFSFVFFLSVVKLCIANHFLSEFLGMVFFSALFWFCTRLHVIHSYICTHSCSWFILLSTQMCGKMCGNFQKYRLISSLNLFTQST